MTAPATLGVDLYHRLRAQPGNLLVSPYSIWCALAMLFPGARGATREELAARLGITSVDAVAALGRELARRAEPTPHQRRMIEGGYQAADSYGFHLAIANQLWVQTGYRVAPAYGQALAAAFGADAAPVDFAGAPDAAAAAINRWVDAQTRGRIPTIVSARQLAGAIRAVLANAIYFKAGWADEFSPAATRPGPFLVTAGNRVDVPMMRQVAYLDHAEDEHLIAVALPYVQPDVAMIVLLPRGFLPDADRALAPARVEALVAALANRRVDLQLPRFRFETSVAIGAELRAIGLGTTLSPAADLSGISDEPGFGVSEVLHKTFVAVDERGTEAAAVTAMALAGSAPPRDQPLPVIVDRPFYVLIRDRPTGTALFFGRVVDPR